MILLTLAFCFVVLELGLARYYSEEQSANRSRFHPVRGWALIPGEYSVKPRYGLSRFTIHINDFGLRSQSLPAGLRNRRRLLILGDSFTFAKETRTEKMFTQRLQELLDEVVPGGVEVVNAGVPAYGTAQQLLFMRELNEEYQLNPEMYVLVFFTNDILDNLCLSYGNLIPQPARPCYALSEEGWPVLERIPERRSESNGDDTLVAARQAEGGLKTVAVMKAVAEEWLQTKPGLVRLLSRMGVSTRVARMPGLLNGWYREDIVAEGAALTGALIRQIQEEARERGGQLVVAMIPSPIQVYPEIYIPLLQKSFPDNSLVDRFVADKSRPQRLVEEMCLEAGIPFHDLLPLFLQNNGKALFSPRDGHLNDAGHRLVAENVLPFVVIHLPEMEE